MKLLLFVFLTIGTVGCPKSTNLLHAEAMGCGKELVIEPNGIVRKPTEQEKADQCTPAWKAYNKRMDVIFEREEQKRKEQERIQADRAKCGGRPPVYKNGSFWGCLKR